MQRQKAKLAKTHHGEAMTSDGALHRRPRTKPPQQRKTLATFRQTLDLTTAQFRIGEWSDQRHTRKQRRTGP
jgi:hypothetical protein